ncbi:ferredoxin [Nocardiopsis lambiniae]|uniref:Ferredoxin n=1 Tax=Nocardiopsis lambiniae TaxID=3075539 RepID=A0ABU2MB39_9ACTN|nr:ferredoxin [Nocardiopsis sp. DSM 44743]MDT0329894.1 ferredoxin [Nocardiopsis sp. DSM 44743]
MRIHVDRTRCANHGQCVFAAPGVFSFDDDENLVYDPAPEAARAAEVARAAAACPVRAVTVEGGPA